MSHPPSEINLGDWESLTSNINEIAPYLTLSGVWEGDDVDADEDRVMRVLQEKSAVVKVSGHNSNTVRNEYRWKESVKERLIDYHNQMDKLPCGHRSHIYNIDDDGFGCKYCEEIDGESPTYSKETVKECL